MNAKNLTSETFDSTIDTSQQPVLVDFWADWCGPCKMLAPVVDQLALEQQGKALVAKVNVDESPEIINRFGITAVPTLIIFKNGEPVRVFRGVQSKSVIATSLAAAA